VVKHHDQEKSFLRFVKENSSNNLIQYRTVDTVDELFATSDVILSSVTYAEHDLISKSSFMKPGTLLIPIHTRGFMKLDSFVDRVYCDDIDQVRGFKYFNDFKNIAEVSEVITGNKPGRQSDDERIIVYNIGLALHDIYFAEMLYRNSISESVESIDLKTPHEKVWYW